MAEGKLIKEIKDWVEEIYFNANHLVRAAYWVKKLNPKASEAVIIAALTHDIERAFERGRKPPKEEMAKWDDIEYNLWHGERSAKFVSRFLKKKGAPDKLIKKVSDLVAKHELGGDYQADLVKDADSLSFLEVNAPIFISWVPEKLSRENVRGKLDYMFNRITIPKARKLAEPFYQKAIKELAQQSSSLPKS